MILAGIDFETTSLDIPTLRVAEVGLVLWDTDLDAPVSVRGFLVDTGDTVWSEEAMAANGLSSALCEKYGVNDVAACKAVLATVDKADVVVAHYGENFDHKILTQWASRHGFTVSEKLWIDTSTDLAVDAHSSSRLSYMAADHGILNQMGHRAVFDVVVMMQVLAQYELNDVIATAKSPHILVRATLSYDDRDLAKARKYHWEKEYKVWCKTIRECDFEQEQKEAPFPVDVITLGVK
jgi:DNA polymerase-3 subunit epsilon